MLVELPFNLPGRIFRSPMPFSPYASGDLWESYQEEAVDMVVVLTELQEYLVHARRDLVAFYEEAGLDVIHLPIPDFQTPTDLVAFGDALQAVEDYAKGGWTIAVHCMAGVGRTGIFMACLARRILGFSGSEAITWVRGYVPGSLENSVQERFVINVCGNQ